MKARGFTIKEKNSVFLHLCPLVSFKSGNRAIYHSMNHARVMCKSYKAQYNPLNGALCTYKKFHIKDSSKNPCTKLHTIFPAGNTRINW